MKRVGKMLSLIVSCTILMGCGSEVSDIASSNFGGQETNDSATIADSSTATAGSRSSTPQVLVPEASGVDVYSNADASIDASNASEGYVMVAYTGSASKVRMLIETPEGNTYNYLMDLDGEYDVYPLSEGDGAYNIGVYENIKDDQYSLAFSQSVTVTLKNEYTAFLYPNAYVDFNSSSDAVAKGQELATGADTDLDVVDSVYHYIIENVSYDYDKAETVQSGYIPDVDDTLATGKGICFDYASLMGAMLRSQGIPTRLDIGYAGTEYHAWISVYIEGTGWIDDIIEFDGTSWTLMDPTLGSYAKKSTIKDHWDSKDTYYQLKYKY